MFDNEKDFKEIVDRLNVDAKPNDAHRQDLRRQMLSAFSESLQKTLPHASPWPIIWRTIMNKPITKLATVAAILLIVVSTVTFFNHLATPAYAIEQTVEAFKKVNAVYVEETIREKGVVGFGKMWARRGRDGRFFFGDFRRESSAGDITVASESENLTYRYNPSTKTVHIHEGLTVTIGDFLDSNFFLRLKEEMEDVEIKYGKDESSGRDVVSLKYKEPSQYQSISKCGVITFDLESKLPTRFKLWDNPDFKGDTCIEWTLIEYNPKLSEDTFKFEIPKDVKVIKD